MKSTKYILSNIWVLVILVSLAFVSCTKGDEPIPMSSTNDDNSTVIISTSDETAKTRGIVGGDDNEDDDDNRGVGHVRGN